MITIIAVALAMLAGCGSGAGVPEGAEVAYVGPYELELRAELSPEAAITATLHHGDRVYITDRRRRFVRVVTGGQTGRAEGWTDGWMLLAPHEMSRTQQLATIAGSLPPQGQAKVYDRLNVHTAPNRQAPSFFQIDEGMSVAVVAHRIAPREAYEPPATDDMVFPRPTYRLPPDHPPPPGGADDWSLVRLQDGRAGWALTRMLAMSIPDEVAQHAGGQLITAYFTLGEVRDGGRTRNHWLWTTLSSGLAQYEFDGLRVFVWNSSRHRYETAYSERNLIGYYPVEVDRNPAKDGRAAQATFSLIVRDKEGMLERRTYSFSGYRVHLASKEPWQAPQEPPVPASDPPPDAEAKPGLFRSVVAKIRSWIG